MSRFLLRMLFTAAVAASVLPSAAQLQFAPVPEAAPLVQAADLVAPAPLVESAPLVRPARPGSPPSPVTYQDVRKLLELGIDEEVVLLRLAKSPTRFVLDDAQRRELTGLGATPRLLAAMEGRREEAKNPEIGDFVLVLDCSASMSEPTSEGLTKMESAKRAVSDLIGRVPEGRRLAFLIYGHDRKLACRAVKVVRPMAEVDAAGRSELAGLVDLLEPVGSTPIANALRLAGRELDPQVPATMVLVSDGMETCKGDPAAEAADLAARFNLTFGVVGFDVKPEERASLEQIAAAGKGRYFDARTATELVKAAEEVAAIEPLSEPEGDGEALGVAEPLELWVTKHYDSWENVLHSELTVNGRPVGTFGLAARKPIAKFLRRGWNTIELTTEAQASAGDDNGLFFRIGPTRKNPETGEAEMASVLWSFHNNGGWTLENGRFRHRLGPEVNRVTLRQELYYAGYEDEGVEPRDGDYVVKMDTAYDSWSSPLSATVFVNGTPLSSAFGPDRSVRVTNLLRPGKNEVKVVTRPVADSMDDNDVTIEVGGPIAYSPGRDGFVFTPLAEAKAMTPWTRDEATGRLVRKGDPRQAEFVRTLTFVVDELSATAAK